MLLVALSDDVFKKVAELSIYVNEWFHETNPRLLYSVTPLLLTMSFFVILINNTCNKFCLSTSLVIFMKGTRKIRVVSGLIY